MDTRKARQTQFGLMIGALLLCCFVFRLFTYVIDDAFITYRYAWHWRHGYGPVFNPGERTEGYSCPLYMALTTLLMFLPGDVLFRAKVIGIAAALGTLWAAWRLAGELNLPIRARAVIPMLLGANASFALSAVDGMETTLQAFLVTLAVWLFVRERRSGQGWASSVVFLAAALNRAEGAIYFVAALIPFILDVRHRFRRRDAIWLSAFLLPMALFVIWRHAYYGDWLPNTVAAKSLPLETALDYSMGPAYLLRTVFSTLNARFIALAVSICLWLLVLLGCACPAVRRGSAQLVILGVLAQSLVVLRSGGDWMIGWRYMTAAVPLWTLLLATGVNEMVALVIEGKNAVQIAWALRFCYAALLALFIVVGMNFVAVPEAFAQTSLSWAASGWTTDARTMLERQSNNSSPLHFADALRTWLPAGASVAYSEMGITPFFTPHLRWLDTDGLTDREVAHLASMKHTRAGIEYGAYLVQNTEASKLVLRRRPDYIVAIYVAGRPLPPVLGDAYQFFKQMPFYNATEHAHDVFVVLRRRAEPHLKPQ
jgi:hypothetical protein